MGLCARRRSLLSLPDVVKNDEYSSSPLVEAVRTRDVARVRSLLQRGGHSVAALEESLLIAAKAPGYVAGQEIALLLVRHGARAKIRDVGRNALDWAVRLQNEELAQYLLEAGATPLSTGTKAVTRCPVHGLMRSYMDRPPSLMQLARRTIREECLRWRGDAVGPVEKLPLPSSLKDYLKLNVL